MKKRKKPCVKKNKRKKPDKSDPLNTIPIKDIKMLNQTIKV